MRFPRLFLIPLLLILFSCERKDFSSILSPSDTVHVTGIRITPSEAASTISKTTQFEAILIYSDNSTVDITSVATWQVTGAATVGGTPGSIIASATSGSATISATYKSYSSTASGSDALLQVTNDFFVSPLGNDATGTGESDDPYATIDMALSAASSGTNIRIAEGNYTTTGITLSTDNISLYGGYATDWSRDLTNNRAIITDTSSTGGSPGPGTPKATITGSAALTSATIIEGLEISGSTDSGVTISAPIDTGGGSPIIRYCTLDGGSPSSSAYCLYISGASPRIESCTMYSGTTANSYGIRISAATSVVIANSTFIITAGTTSNHGIAAYNGSGNVYIYNNIIRVDNPSSVNSTGIDAYSQAFIANNTFILESATTSMGVTTAYGSGPYLYNNIFIFLSGTYRYGIYEGTYPGNDPSAVCNNIFYNTTVLYHDYTSADWTDVATMEAGAVTYGSTAASGNSIADPVLVGSGDYHLTALSPTVATSGGLNGMDEGWVNFPMNAAATYPVDIAGNLRPVLGGGNWSIGAYQ